MNFTEHFQFRVGGFSAHRVAYALAAMSFGFVPVHFYVSCEASVATAAIGTMLFLACTVLSLVAPRGTAHRFRPIGFALVAVTGHSLFTH